MLESNSNFSAINLACGGKLCLLKGWINADHNPYDKRVKKINLMEKLPFNDNSFDIIYHSQFIEHLPYSSGLFFMKECFRILKKGGIIRVVTPDLQNQTKEYLNHLSNLLNDPEDNIAKSSYEWIRLEMLDQLYRHQKGGEMIEYLNQNKENMNLKNYVVSRLGRGGKIFFKNHYQNEIKSRKFIKKLKKLFNYLINKVTPKIIKIGKFRTSGECHLEIYDQYLLTKLFHQSGFKNIQKQNVFKSNIKKWNETLLDVDSNGKPEGEASLFMEAIK